jgi:hypothetical protein
MEHTLYEIGISLYSDELYPDDYIDGQENIYQMNEEQYKKFNDIGFTCSDDIHLWCIENLDESNIHYAQEFIDEVAHLDEIVFDYHLQEYLLES